MPRTGSFVLRTQRRRGVVGLFIDSTGRGFFTVDGHRDNGKRFTVSGDEMLTALLELERVTRDAEMQ